MKELFKEIIVNSQEKDYSLVIDREERLPLESDKIVTAIGIRRSGKTHLLFTAINEVIEKYGREAFFYISFEDDRIYPTRLSDLNTLLEAYYELYPEQKNSRSFFFFDEIQEVENWEKFIRRVYDTENCSIFVTGSSSKLLSKEIATGLRGRTITYEVFPLSFSEYLHFKGIKPNSYSSRTKAKILKSFNDYLAWGGFPDIVNRNDFQKREILKSYVELITYRDLVERYGVSNLSLLRFILKSSLKNISTLLSFNKFFNQLKSQGIKTGKNTVYEYFGYLQDGFVLFQLPIWAESEAVIRRNPQKIYAIDTGLKQLVSITKDAGRIIENVVFLHLRRNYDRLFYYKGKQEVDFVVETPQGIRLINVAYELDSLATREREINGLVEAMDHFELEKGQIISYEHEETIEVNQKLIEVIPLWKWLLK